MPNLLMGWVKVDRFEANWPINVVWDIKEIVCDPKALPPPNNAVVIFSFDPKDLDRIKEFITSPEFVEKFGVDTDFLGGSGIYSDPGGTFHSWPTEP